VPLNCRNFKSTALVLALMPLVPANGTEYDHVRPELASELASESWRSSAGARRQQAFDLGFLM